MHHQLVANKCILQLAANVRSFFCVIGKPYWESVDELNGYHLAADTCIAFHAKHADINDPVEIVVQVNDTHIATILLANIDLFSS